MADDEEAVLLACTSFIVCALCVHVNKKEKHNTQCGRKTIWENERLFHVFRC